MKSSYKPRNQITEMEIEEIRKQNRERLDYILSQGEEYLIRLAIKYYGESWMCIFNGERSYLHKERIDHNIKNGGALRGRTTGNRVRPLQKIDLKTNEVLVEYKDVFDCIKGEGMQESQIPSVIAVMTGRTESYKGFKWRFCDEQQIIRYGKD
jgi:hypothetical protein